MIGQVAMLFFVCALLTALFTYATMLLRSDQEVKERTESLARMIALDVKQSIAEYPTADWLLRYWQDHCDDMDIEYDVKYFKLGIFAVFIRKRQNIGRIIICHTITPNGSRCL